MLSKRTIIGLVVGGAISAIGLYSLIDSLGLQTEEIDHTYEIAENTSYRFMAPTSAKQFVEIKGKSFQVTLESPEGGLQIRNETYKDELTIEWVHLEEGESFLKIKNLGDSELHVTGTLQFITEFIEITYHIMVLTAGVVIIGFSAGFSIRKPQGF